MKATLLLIIGAAFALASCKSVDPEYESYKAQQAEQGSQTAPFGNTDPYGSAVANPYGVPGGSAAPSSDVGRYTPQNPAPYQPLPGVPSDPSGTRSGFPTIPSPGAGGTITPSGPTTTHIVTTGDSLWGLSRKYGTTVEAIQQANGLSGNTIQTGRTLQIPSN
jgi:LysM repeat protein